VRGERLGRQEHVVHYIKPRFVDDDGRPNAAAFRLRRDRPDETGLSVNWLEAAGHGKMNQLSQVRRLLRMKRSPKGRFAEMNAGTLESITAECMGPLRIVHEPLEATEEFEEDPTHSEIVGLPPMNLRTQPKRES